VIVPLMIANLVSYFISARLQKMPIYEVLAEQDGIHLPRARAHRIQTQRQVGQVMRPATDVLLAEEDLARAARRVEHAGQQVWLVCDRRGVVGVLTQARLREASKSAPPGQKVGDLVRGREFPHLHSDQPFDLALDRMGATQLDLLPVVSRANVHELQGIVRLNDLLNSYGLKSTTES